MLISLLWWLVLLCCANFVCFADSFLLCCANLLLCGLFCVVLILFVACFRCVVLNPLRFVLLCCGDFVVLC